MKVGTDGVLIGCWCGVDDRTRQVLDVGCGSGVITLILAQRTEVTKSTITAIDIDNDSYLQAIENVEQSEWHDRVSVEHVSLQDFCKSHIGKFDLIVSNPPFFVNSLKAPDTARNNSRHCDTLSHEELLKCSSELLVDGGKLSVILPTIEAERLVQMAVVYGLTPSRICTVGSSAKKRDIRRMVELTKTTQFIECSRQELLIHSGGDYSEEYRDLTHDFYLRF